MTTFDSWLAEHAAARDQRGLTRRLSDSDRGKSLLDLAGNDYLGLARDPRVISGAVAAARKFGAGACASRVVAAAEHRHAVPRPGITPMIAGRRLDDLAYGAGLWWGAIRSGSPRALLPRRAN